MCDSSLQFPALLGADRTHLLREFPRAPLVLGHQRGGVDGAPVFLAGRLAGGVHHLVQPAILDRPEDSRKTLPSIKFIPTPQPGIPTAQVGCRGECFIDADCNKPPMVYVSCGRKNFLLFSAKDLFANDATKLGGTIDQAAVGPADGARRIVATSR
jgi:hypothetical protein